MKFDFSLLDVRLAQPWWLLLLLLLPVLIFRMARARGADAPRLRFSNTAILGRSGTTLRAIFRPLPRLFLLLAFVFTAIALARPQSPWQEHQRKTEGISIMLVMDVSESMRALDFQPNRLEKSKEVVKEFVRGRKDDMIGAVIFARDTFTLCPLTHDYAALETFIDRINFDLVEGNGTAIGMGLANGVNKIKDSPTKSKVIILLTDGENNAGEIQPMTAAEVAQKLEVRVYTIGVGSRGVVDIPMAGPGGGWVVGSIQSNIDTETLTKIAKLTGGQFFEASSGEKLAEIYKQIDKMERTIVETREANYFDELAHYFILPALILLGLAFMLEQTWLWSFP